MPAERWPADDAHIDEAAARLRRGAVIAFPTETVYGVGCRSGNPAAVARLYSVKRRPGEQPVVLLVSGVADVRRLAVMTPAADRLLAEFWPGPLTVVLARRQESPSLGTVSATLAFRAPDHPVTLRLLRATGEPMASSSANRAGRPPPRDAQGVIAELGDDIDLVLDDGPARLGQPSTIVDLTGAYPQVLREGALPSEMLLALLDPR